MLELSRRKKKNPNYSLRAFATSLQTDCGTLSKILNGKREMGTRAIMRMCKSLGLSPREQRFYTNLSSDKRESAEFHKLEVDRFTLISEWYHFAILELVKVNRFKPDSAWIAESLGITKIESVAAIERLVRLGFLEIKGKSEWKNITPKTTTSDQEFTTRALKDLQIDLLRKGVDAVEKTPFNERDNSSVTMAIDINRLPRAKILIKQFRKDLVELLTDSSDLSSVYNLSVALFPLDDKNGGT